MENGPLEGTGSQRTEIGRSDKAVMLNFLRSGGGYGEQKKVCGEALEREREAERTRILKL